MRKTAVALSILLLFILVGCTSHKSAKFFTVYNDFVSTKSELQKDLMQSNSVYTFSNDDSWSEFKSKYYNECDLPKVSLTGKTLICLPIFSARPTCVVQNYVDEIQIQGDMVTVYTNTTGVKYSGDEYQDDAMHNLILVTIDSKTLPKQYKIQKKEIN